MLRMFRSLGHRNFRLFVEGQSLSLIGSWIQQIAVTWLTYKMTNSMWMLGVVNFAGQIPYLLISPFGGIMADRWNKHKLLLLTQSMALAQALLFSILYFTEAIMIWQIIVLSIILGIINAVDMPIRQSFIPEMLEDSREDLNNAIAINSIMVNSARLMGPSLAGLMIATIGEGWCFMANSLSFVAVVVSLLLMKVKYIPAERRQKDILAEISEGARYALGSSPIKYFLYLLSVIGIVTTFILTLAPAFVKIYLDGDATTYGLLMGAYGFGAFFSATYLLLRKHPVGLEIAISMAAAAFGMAMIAFALSTIVWLSIVFMAITGAGFLLNLASTNTLLQTVSEKSKRGRVMSFYAVCFKGTGPLGSLLSGGLAEVIGAKFTIIVGGIICVISSYLYSKRLYHIRRKVVRIYKHGAS